MTTDSVIAAKKTLRGDVLAMRDALTESEREKNSAAITARLIALPALASAATVAAYMSFGTEFNTGALIREVTAKRMNLVLPRVDREHKRIDFYSVTDLNTALVPGRWGIREPDPARCARVDANRIDFMLVPGVAFTPRCERLGYGGGFYDGAIAAIANDVMKVAAAFSVQIVDELPVEPHDRCVDLVVTESAVYRHKK
jgi:5,10-methenyltetrahydrofolate synthetase